MTKGYLKKILFLIILSLSSKGTSSEIKIEEIEKTENRKFMCIADCGRKSLKVLTTGCIF